MLIHIGTFKDASVEYDTRRERLMYLEKKEPRFVRYASVSIPMPDGGCIGDDDDPIIAWCEQHLEGFRVSGSFPVTHDDSYDGYSVW